VVYHLRDEIWIGEPAIELHPLDLVINGLALCDSDDTLFPDFSIACTMGLLTCTSGS
jgi:hypothetical protein